MFKKCIFPLLPTLLAVLLSVGCNLKEDLSDCGVLRFAFRYTCNNENVDRLKAHVQDIHVYAFDMETRLLADVIEVGPADIARGWVEIDDLPDGRYTFVAWGGSSEDMSRSFSEAHMHDATTHDHSDPRIGTTTLDEFYMMLDYNELPADVHGDIAPAREDFDDLFHAAAERVEVSKGRDQTVDFDLIRNANVLKVTVTGFQHLTTAPGTRAASPDQPLSVYAVGKNGRYMWDNTIDWNARQVRYESPYTSLDETSMQVDIKTLRLDVERHATEPVNLYVSDPVTGQGIIAPLDVVKTILRVKDDEGNSIYQTQEDIDREYEFPINISILADLSVRISLGEWVVENTAPDISRP